MTVYVETKIEKELERKTSVLATKEDISFIRQDIVKMESSIRQDMQKQRAELLYWVLGAWLAGVGAIGGLMFTFLKAMGKL